MTTQTTPNLRQENEKLIREYRDLFVTETLNALKPTQRPDARISRHDNMITIAFDEISFHITITTKRASADPAKIRAVLNVVAKARAEAGET